MHVKQLLAATTLFIAFSHVAVASPFIFYEDETSWYVGVYGNQTNTTIEFDSDIELLDDDADGFAGSIGFNINRYFSVEVGYTDFGSPSSIPFGKSQNDAFSFGILAGYEFFNHLKPYLKLGYVSWDTKDDDGTQVGGTDPMAGAGIAIKLIDNIQLDLRYEYFRFDINNENVVADVDAEIELESTSAGIRYIF